MSKDKTKSPIALVGIDYLQYTTLSTFLHNIVSQKGDDDEGHFRIGDAWYFEKQEYGSRYFRKRYKVWYHGTPAATMLAEPVQGGMIPDHFFIFKIENHLLYARDLWEVVDGLNYITQSTVQNISRLDVFCDMPGGIDICQKWYEGDVEMKGRSEAKPFLTTKREMTSLTVGSRKSDKYCRVYNKEKEMGQQTDKPYIRNWWKDNGLEINHEGPPVCRIEVTLKSKIFKRTEKFAWQKLRDPKYLVKLFITNIESQLTFYLPTHSRTNKCPVVKYLPDDIVFANRLRKTERVESKIQWRKKVAMKGHIEEFVKQGRNLVHFNLAKELATLYELEDYFDTKIDEWLEMFSKRYAPDTEMLTCTQIEAIERRDLFTEMELNEGFRDKPPDRKSTYIIDADKLIGDSDPHGIYNYVSIDEVEHLISGAATDAFRRQVSKEMDEVPDFVHEIEV